MRMRTLFLAATLLLGSGWVRAEDYAPGEVIVKFRKGVARPMMAFQAAPLKTFGIGTATERARAFKEAMEDYAVIKLSPGVSVESAIQALQARGDIEYAGPNHLVRAFGVPNDTNFSNQWGMRNTGQIVQSNTGISDADIDATEAWDVTTGSASVIVAIVDSGLDLLHPDIVTNVWINTGEIASDGIDNDSNGVIDDVNGANFDRLSGAPTGDPTDSYHHGTHVAGIIGALGNNNRGVAGVAWNVRIMPLRFLDSGGSGTVAHAIEAIQYAVANGAVIINNSWGTTANDIPLHAAVTAAKNAGVVIVAAAGNDNNSSTVQYPAGFVESIAVSATTNRDTLLTYNHGPHVDLGAPGRDVGSTFPSNQYAYLSGTSMATPHVSGVAALMKSLSSSLTPDQVQAILKASVDVPSGWNFTYGVGRLNAHTAVRSVGDAAAPVVNLTSPASGVAVNGAAVSLTANATDDKVVTKVWFLVDGVILSTDTTSPYTATWNSTLASEGAHTLTARAFDGAGNSTNSNIGVVVGNSDVVLPTISISSPAAGASIFGSVPVNAAATDNVGVARVWFFLDGVHVSTDSAAAYSWTFDTLTVANGAHTLAARSFDAVGNSSSTSIMVTVANPDVSSPTVSVSAPADGAQLYAAFNITASASDNLGVSTVQFLVDGVLAASDVTAPYAASLDTVNFSAGTRSLTAIAFDDAGNSSSHTITAVFREAPVDSVAPSVTIPGLAAGARVNGTIQLAAAASDDVAVVRVELFVDGALIETDSSAPFEFSLNTVSFGSGAHVASMKAYDADGNVGTASVAFTVGGYSIGQFHPMFNPMKGEAVTIPLNLGETMRVEARLMDRFGHVVADLADSDLSPGAVLSWDGRTVSNDMAASGVYFLYLNIGGEVTTRKIIVRK